MWKLRKEALAPAGFRPSRPLDSPERKIAYVSDLMAELGEDPPGSLVDAWLPATAPGHFCTRIGDRKSVV